MLQPSAIEQNPIPYQQIEPQFPERYNLIMSNDEPLPVEFDELLASESVSYFQALEVALISGLMLGASVFFLWHAFFAIGAWHWIMFILIGVLTMYFQLSTYKRILQ